MNIPVWLCEGIIQLGVMGPLQTLKAGQAHLFLALVFTVIIGLCCLDAVLDQGSFGMQFVEGQHLLPFVLLLPGVVREILASSYGGGG